MVPDVDQELLQEWSLDDSLRFHAEDEDLLLAAAPQSALLGVLKDPLALAAKRHTAAIAMAHSLNRLLYDARGGSDAPELNASVQAVVQNLSTLKDIGALDEYLQTLEYDLRFKFAPGDNAT